MNLNDKIIQLLKNPSNSSEFTSLFSLESNWEVVDKSIKIPKGTAISEIECPDCLNTLRVLYDKFNDSACKFRLRCPHCEEVIKFKTSYEGYTADLNIDYDL